MSGGGVFFPQKPNAFVRSSSGLLFFFCILARFVAVARSDIRTTITHFNRSHTRVARESTRSEQERERENKRAREKKERGNKRVKEREGKREETGGVKER